MHLSSELLPNSLWHKWWSKTTSTVILLWSICVYMAEVSWPGLPYSSPICCCCCCCCCQSVFIFKSKQFFFCTCIGSNNFYPFFPIWYFQIQLPMGVLSVIYYLWIFYKHIKIKIKIITIAIAIACVLNILETEPPPKIIILRPGM